ncbi:MAG: hypothetical protein WC408_01120 [Candidatus Micrarchaeia archaeon]|jgi:hypothetical protein
MAKKDVSFEQRNKIADALRKNPTLGFGSLARTVDLSEHKVENILNTYKNEHPEFNTRLNLPRQKQPSNKNPITSEKKGLIIEAYGKSPQPQTIQALSIEHGIAKSKIIDLLLEDTKFLTASERTRAFTELKYGRR